MMDLLDGVNEVLKKTDVLDSDSGLLASLTDSGRQVFIDTAVQSLNETVDELYALSSLPKPKQLKESTITLATGVKDYALHSKLVTLRRDYHLIDETNNHIITVLGEDGYRQLIIGDIEQDDTGLPHWGAISPIDGRLYLDRAPTANENGRVYKYRFEKDLQLTDATDEFPFTNAVFRQVVQAAAERYKFHRHLEFSDGLYNRSLGLAARFLRRLPVSQRWGKQVALPNATDPFG